MQALNMSAALTAKKTKEFRSPPQEQINMLLNFKDEKQECPCPETIREQLMAFHEDLMIHCGIEIDEDRASDCNGDFTIRGRLMLLVEKVAYLKRKIDELPKKKKDKKPSTLQQLISDTMIRWAQESVIEDPELVRAIDIMNNKVFYQHPNLMRALGMHETVMEVMVNVLSGGESKEITFPKMVANCCRFLCYFCRISPSPSMRGSTPLDVAAASVMDNNELALALREPDLEKVVQYLAGCG
ncbi:hypothetical protein CRUP_001124, partial [Coryphaenoides rupestris]